MVPKRNTKDSLTLFNKIVKSAGFFLLFHGPNETTEKEDDNVRISSATMEIAFLKKSAEIYRESYAACKMLKHRHFCPSIQFNDPDDDIFENDSDLQDEEWENLADKKKAQLGTTRVMSQPCVSQEKTINLNENANKPDAVEVVKNRIKTHPESLPIG